jgi:hypothetical protein
MLFVSTEESVALRGINSMDPLNHNERSAWYPNAQITKNEPKNTGPKIIDKRAKNIGENCQFYY